DRCLNLGQACPNGGGQCAAGGPVCKFPIDSCVPADYQRPRVAIATLPAGLQTVVDGLAAVKPAGNTPLAPAFDGALAHARQYLATQPGHRGAMVIATDGAPSGCEDDSIATVASHLAAARTGMPALPTYVIGVLDAADTTGMQTMQTLATAGGTSMPFLLNAN